MERGVEALTPQAPKPTQTVSAEDGLGPSDSDVNGEVTGGEAPARETGQQVTAADVAESVLSVHEDVLDLIERFNRAVGDNLADQAALARGNEVVKRAQQAEREAALIDEDDPARSDVIAAARAYIDVAKGIRDAQEAWNNSLAFDESSPAHRIIEDQFWPARERSGWSRGKYRWEVVEGGLYDRMTQIARPAQQ